MKDGGEEGRGWRGGRLEDEEKERWRMERRKDEGWRGGRMEDGGGRMEDGEEESRGMLERSSGSRRGASRPAAPRRPHHII